MKVLLFVIVLANIPAYAMAQGAAVNQFVQILPAITFVSTVFISIVNVYLINRLNKSKEDVLKIVRAELKEEINELEKKMVTKDQMELVRTEMSYRLKSIEEKINHINK